jgi:hypothetical protein
MKAWLILAQRAVPILGGVHEKRSWTDNELITREECERREAEAELNS